MNSENGKKIAFLVVLVLVAGFMFYRSMNSLGGGGGQPAAGTKTAAGSSGSGIVEFKSVFEQVDVDIKQLMENIKDVEFVYSDTQIARDPSAPVLKGVIDDKLNPVYPLTDPSLAVDSLLYLAQLKEVTGIIFDNENPMAVVDGDIVYIGYEFREGDNLETIVVKSIGEDHVVFSIPSEDQEIRKDIVEVTDE